MKKVLILMSLLLPLIASAADWGGMEVKMWSDGDISWADFKGAAP